MNSGMSKEDWIEEFIRTLVMYERAELAKDFAMNLAQSEWNQWWQADPHMVAMKWAVRRAK